MRIMFNKHFICLITLLLLTQSYFTQNFIIPKPTGKVISDFENVLSEKEQEELSSVIRKFYEETSNQIMVVFVPTNFINEYPIESYATSLFNAWGPGQKGINNGVMLIIAGSETDIKNRKARIEVGTGLMNALPNDLCQTILNTIIVPQLKEYNYVSAVKSGCNALIEAIKKNVESMGIKKNMPNTGGDFLSDELGVFTLQEYNYLNERLKNINPDYYRSLVSTG